MTAALVSGLLAGYGVALPIGAIGAYLATLSARTSLRVGAAAALGVATADGLYALLAVTAGRPLAALLTPVATPLRTASAGILLALAAWTTVRAVRTYRTRSDAPADPLPHKGSALRGGPGARPLAAYLSLLGLTILNPLTMVYFAALVTGSRPTTGIATAAAFVVAAFTASASWQLTLASAGAALSRLLTTPRARLLTTLASALLIAGLAVRSLVT
ncbi:LysE family transporter [Actinocatenispora rupis]|uniref:Lysine transporter LysE n=1 Tax=Actinocatenispora rupis TaxID=519421 RepID=A0A8J3N9Z4_9ACTN|nr:LysE family transporter [Actinocatenispora rupis]GID11839.1 lysine transporter LysE [Actinocatenispora rupis]